MDTTLVVPDHARSRPRASRSERVIVRLTPAERARLELVAVELGVTISEVLRAALSSFGGRPMSAPEPLVTASEVAGWLSVDRLRVYELARTQQIPSLKIGRSVRFDPAKVREWIENGGTAEGER